jgi:hypothetical protein
MTRKILLTFVYSMLIANTPGVRTCAKVQGTNPATLRVSVFNDANVPRGQLLRAERLASGAFAQAGISVVWLPCGGTAKTPEEQLGCTEVSFPAHLHVRIVQRSLNLNLSTFGMSFQEQDGSGAQVDIFYEGIVRLQECGRTDSGIVLGTVMAHELGHLLLGKNSHAETGVMRPSWNPADFAAASQGRLSFSDDQRHILKARLDSAESASTLRSAK